MQALDTYRGETVTKGNNKKTEEQTWICTVQSLLFQSHDGRHAISTLQLIHLRLTHFQCSQYRELQSMLQIPSRLPREYESPSPDHRSRNTVVVTLFSDTATCCTFINVFVTESVISWYAHPNSQIAYRASVVKCARSQVRLFTEDDGAAHGQITEHMKDLGERLLHERRLLF